jgi:hypothetical protein
MSVVPAANYRVAGARAGVIGQLFPAVAQQLQPLLRTPFRAKKQAALRWRTAQARSIVERCTREIKALETRAAIAPGDAYAQEARSTRLGELRQEAGVTEGRILLLKARQRKLGLPSRNGWVGDTQRLVETWLATEERSAQVLLSLLVKSRDPWDLIRQDTISLLRLGSNAALVAGYAQLPGMDRLAPHAPAIAARAAKLERYAPGILIAVEGHLDAIEPHLDEILQRLDAIEPHLPFVLRNLDTLAPHAGSLLKHIDALLLYCDDGGKYLEPLLPYVSRFAPLLDKLGPHLALLRPHMKHLLPHMHVVAPSAYRFARQLSVSANADVLLFYFGWVLRIPLLGRVVLRLPFMPRLAACLGKRLPSRVVRGKTCDYICDWDGCDVEGFTSELSAAAADAYCSDLWGEGYARKRQRIRSTSAVVRRTLAAGVA